LYPNEKVALKIFAFLGLLISLAVNMYLVYGPFSVLMYTGNPAHTKIILATTISVQMLSAILASVGVARLLIALSSKMKNLYAAGALAGAVAAGGSFGLTMAVMFALAVPVGAITLPVDGMDNWSLWRISGSVFMKTFIYGALPGIPLGILSVLLLSRLLKGNR